MPDRYYVLNCEDPEEGYLARISYSSDDLRRSWLLAERFANPPPEPLSAVIRGLDEEGTVLADLWLTPLPVMSRRLHAALIGAGVDNLDTYAVVLRDPAGGRTFDDYLAFNVIGKIAAADLAASDYDAAQTDRRVAMDIDRLVLASARPRGALMFRLAESVNTLLVHGSVRQRIEDAGIATLTFYAPEDWAT